MTSVKFALFLIISVLFSVQICASTSAFAADKTLSVYERVVKSGKIRCGYVNLEPWFMREPNTNKMSGIFYDVTNLIAKKLSLKVEWAQETCFGTMVTDLQNDRYDVLCSGSWEAPSFTRGVKFGQQVFYMPVYAIVRADDKRFDQNIELANSSDVTISALDGDVGVFIRDEDFPKAKLSALQNMTDFSQVMVEVSTKKADMTFADLDAAQRFIAKNPGTIKIIKTEYPIRLYPASLVYKSNDLEFDSMLGTALRELIYSGEVHKILNKYKADPASYLEVAFPYARP